MIKWDDIATTVIGGLILVTILAIVKYFFPKTWKYLGDKMELWESMTIIKYGAGIIIFGAILGGFLVIWGASKQSSSNILPPAPSGQTSTPVAAPITPPPAPISPQPELKKFSSEEKEKIRNALGRITEINDRKGNTLVKKLEAFPDDFNIAFSPYTGSGGMQGTPDVRLLIEKLEGIIKDCDTLNNDLFESEHAITKEYIVFETELNETLQPQLVKAVIDNIKTQASSILNPGLSVFAARAQGFQSITNFFASNPILRTYDISLEPAQVQGHYRYAEEKTNTALYELTGRNLSTLTTANNDLKIWLQNTARRKEKLRQEIDRQ